MGVCTSSGGGGKEPVLPQPPAGVDAGEMSAAMTLDKTVEGLVRDMALLREAQPAEFSATLSQVLQKRSAPMLNTVSSVLGCSGPSAFSWMARALR